MYEIMGSFTSISTALLKRREMCRDVSIFIFFRLKCESINDSKLLCY